MADKVFAKNAGGSDFSPHPEGTFAAICVDVIDLGMKVEQFGDEPGKLVPKCAIVWRTGEKRQDGEYFDVASEFTVSSHKRAKLRIMMEGWRGKTFSEEEADNLPIHAMVEKSCLVNIVHKTSKMGREYAMVAGVMPMAKGMPAPTDAALKYARAKYWAERAAQYRDEAQKFAPKARTPDPVADMEDEPLPF